MKQLIRERGVLVWKDPLISRLRRLGYAIVGLVHCDVKPHNMLVSPIRASKWQTSALRAPATMTPNVLMSSGVAAFAPEQALGATLTASDVYSSAWSYELFCGTPPFTASTSDELARLHISAPHSHEYIPDIPPR